MNAARATTVCFKLHFSSDLRNMGNNSSQSARQRASARKKQVVRKPKDCVMQFSQTKQQQGV
jgi:hypothetical protein